MASFFALFRAVFVAVCVLTSFVVVAQSAETRGLTEKDAIRRFLGASPQARSVPLVESSALATASEGTRWPNPVLSLGVEDVDSFREEVLTIGTTLPWTGRRGLQRQSAALAGASASAQARAELLEQVADLRVSFFDVLLRERVLQAHEGHVSRLDRIVEALTRREQEGESSGYDLLRAEQERSLAELSRARAQASMNAARLRFAGFFGADAPFDVSPRGDLAMQRAMPSQEVAVEQAFAQRLDLVALRDRQRRREIDAQAAKRRRWPEPQITAGTIRVDDLSSSRSGFVASVSVPLPLFERGQFETSRATVDLKRAELAEEMLRRKIRADVRTALVQERSSKDAADQFEQRATRSSDIQQIAQLAYDEGEMGIVDLIDAFRTSHAATLLGLQLAYDAKKAEIETDRVLGTEVNP